MKKLFCPTALIGERWLDDVLLEVEPSGRIARVTPQAAPDGAERLPGPVLPGMPNLHSHAFQYAMAGLAETRGPGEESFWTWREVMYAFLGKLGPEDIEAIAAQLYLEMLKAGYTAVAEFHYLHHDPAGRPYAERAELSRRVAAAAEATGLRLTHLPVLYAHSGFGGQPPAEGQRRFINDIEGYGEILEALHADFRERPRQRLGLAFHSLRAVTPELMREGLARLDALDDTAPVHIHIAEQTAEVEGCLAHCGKRPVEWLYELAEVGPRWCLVHATHLNAAETRQIAENRAIAGLCLTTEANLGDGLFPAPEFLALGGRYGVGSDSHIGVSAAEELRLLEYGQRLTARQRSLLATPERPSVGATLYLGALDGGRQALGQPIGSLEAGSSADLVVLDETAPLLAARRGDAILDSYVFASGRNFVRETWVAGERLVENGRHRDEAAIAERFRKTMAKLQAAL